MVRQVRGLGTLVPVDEARRWLASSTQGRVERIVLRPGAQVTPDTVILELNDPQLQQQLLEAETQLRASEADLAARGPDSTPSGSTSSRSPPRSKPTSNRPGSSAR